RDLEILIIVDPERHPTTLNAKSVMRGSRSEVEIL
ncbi:hypothetical protein AALP_AA8G100900, partial [Arabis alpina]